MEQTLALIEKSHKGDKNARDILVERNMGLVYTIARRFCGRGCEMEDLIQIGSIGLLKAIDKFDIHFEVRFSTYAVPMITGEIKRFLRDDGIIKVSRSLKETAAKACMAIMCMRRCWLLASLSRASRFTMSMRIMTRARFSSKPLAPSCPMIRLIPLPNGSTNWSMPIIRASSSNCSPCFRLFITKENDFPRDVKIVASRRNKQSSQKRCSWFEKITGIVLKNHRQRQKKLRATFFKTTGNVF